MESAKKIYQKIQKKFFNIYTMLIVFLKSTKILSELLYVGDTQGAVH